MKELLFQYLLIVTVFLCTPLSYGCEIKAGKDYLSCESYFERSSNITELTYKLDYICSDKPSERQKILDCQHNITTKCKTFSKESFVNGTDVKFFHGINSELCKHKEDVRSGLPCYSKYENSMHNTLQTLTSVLRNIRRVVNKNNTLSEEYFKKSCPKLKFLIDTYTGQISNCSEKFVKLFRKYYYVQLPNKCEAIIANQTLEENDTTTNYSDTTTNYSDTTMETTIVNSETTSGKGDTTAIGNSVSNIYFNWLLILTIVFNID